MLEHVKGVFSSCKVTQAARHVCYVHPPNRPSIAVHEPTDPFPSWSCNMYINATYICGESEESLEDAKQQLLREIAAYYAKEAAATLAALTTAGASDSAE